MVGFQCFKAANILLVTDKSYLFFYLGYLIRLTAWPSIPLTNGLLLLVLRIKLWSCLICGRSALLCTSLILTSNSRLMFLIIALFEVIFSIYWSGLLFVGPTGRRFSRLVGIQRMKLSWLLVVWVGGSWCGILAGIAYLWTSKWIY